MSDTTPPVAPRLSPPTPPPIAPTTPRATQVSTQASTQLFTQSTTDSTTDSATDAATDAATPPAAPPSAAAPPRRLALVAGVAGAAALAGLGLSWWRSHLAGQAADNSSTLSLPADVQAVAALWALQVAQPQGGTLPLAGLRGKPLLINFWATWCAPCVREMPEIDRFHREFGPRGWQVLGLAIDGPMPVRAFLSRVKVGFLIGLAGMDGTDLMHGLGNPSGGLPFSVMIGADGRVLRRKLGETRFDQLAAWAADG